MEILITMLVLLVLIGLLTLALWRRRHLPGTGEPGMSPEELRRTLEVEHQRLWPPDAGAGL